jgi:hypothetical protein
MNLFLAVYTFRKMRIIYVCVCVCFIRLKSIDLCCVRWCRSIGVGKLAEFHWRGVKNQKVRVWINVWINCC